MAKHLAPYRTYVIRCWEEPSAQADTRLYRYSLEIPATGERFGFASSTELINALKLAFAQRPIQRSVDSAPPDASG